MAQKVAQMIKSRTVDHIEWNVAQRGGKSSRSERSLERPRRRTRIVLHSPNLRPVRSIKPTMADLFGYSGAICECELEKPLPV